MKRPGYREAVAWLVYNDDTEWVSYEGDIEAVGQISVTGSLICDLFGVSEDRLRADIRRGLMIRTSPMSPSLANWKRGTP